MRRYCFLVLLFAILFASAPAFGQHGDEVMPGNDTGSESDDSTSESADGNESSTIGPKTADSSGKESTGLKGLNDQPLPKDFLQGVDTESTLTPTKIDGSGIWTNILVGLILFAIVSAIIIFIIRRNPKLRSMLGGGPVKVLSRSYLNSKNAVYMIKVGDRILVVGQGTEQLTTLSEITNPSEVQKLLASVEETSGESMSSTFKDALRNISGGGGKSSRIAAKPESKRPQAKAASAKVKQTLPSSSEGDESAESDYSTKMKLAAIRAQIDQARNQAQ